MLLKENETKIFILYLMNCADCGLEYGALLTLAEESGFLGYFDFSAVFSKLLQENNVREETGGGAPLYYITERGAAIAGNLAHLIPTAAKNKCAVLAARLLALQKMGADYYYNIEPENGGYKFTCGIKNKNSALFDISLFVREKSTAEKMRKIFSERPDYIYRAVLGMMTGDAGFIFQD